MNKDNPIGRPKGKPTAVIRIPVDCIPAVEEILGKSIGNNQTRYINLRVPTSKIKKIRKIIKENK